MRRIALVLSAATAALVLSPVGSADAQDLPPLPCAYWVHGCNVPLP